MKTLLPTVKSVVSLLALLLMFGFCGQSFAQTVTTISTSGSFTIPAGVTSIKVEAWGGGGGGDGQYSRGAAGGGGGAYSVQTYTVVPGQVYTITIGAGGSGGTTANFPTAGGITTWTGTAGTLNANGGGAANAYVGGTGGTGTKNGGSGSNTPGTSGNNTGGGGGGGAGNNGNGVAGTVPGGGSGGAGTPSSAPYVGGTGATGGASGVAGANASYPGPGGGGGGGGRNANGGAGAQGQIVLTYTQPPTLTAGTLSAFGNVCTGTTAGPNSFTLSGSSLTSASVTVGPLSGFTFSTSAGGTYTASLTLTPSGGTLSGTPNIYVKFSPTAVASYSGNISVSGGGATSINVAASGAGVSTPPTVTTGVVSAVTNTSSTTGGTISALGCTSVTSYGIEYSTSSGFANGTGTAVSGTGFSGVAGGTLSASLTSLNPQTAYYIHAYATNTNGTGYGSSVNFFTLSNPVTAQASSFAAASGVSSAVLSWNTATFPVSGATGTGYLLLYSTGTPTLTSTNGTAPTAGGGTTLVNITSGATLTSTVSGLTNGTTYNFLLVPYTWDGSNAGTYNYLTTGAPTASCVPVAAPSVTTTTAISAITNITASSGGSGLASNGAAITAKGVVWGTSSNPTVPSGSSTNNGTGTTTFTSSITGLSPQTQYNVRAYAINSVGTGYGPNVVFFTLSNPVTAQPTSFMAAPGSGSIVLNWNTATFPFSGATGTGYLLLYSTGTPTLTSTNGNAPTAGGGTTLVNITSGATLTYTVNSLSAGSTYNFLLVPYTWDGSNAGTYNYYTTGALTTCGALNPSAPGGLGLGTPTATSIPVTITAASPVPTGYVIFYGTTNTVPTTPAAGTTYNAAGSPYTIGGVSYSAINTTTAGTFTINGLAGGTTYYVFVFSYSTTACGSTPIYSGGYQFGNATTLVNTYYLGSSGNADVLASWWSNNNSTGSHPTNFTTAGITYNIINQVTPTLGANWTVSGTGSVVNIGDGSANTPNFTVGGAFVLNATVNVKAGSTLTLSTTGSITNITAGTLDAASTVNFASSSAQVIPAINFGNLTSSGSGNRTLQASGTIGIAGTFTPGTNVYTVTGSTVSFNGSNQTVPVFTFNNLTVNGGAGNVTTLAPGTINVKGTFTDNNTSGLYQTTGNTVNFNGTAAQAIPAISPGYNNLIYSGTGSTTTTPTTFTASATVFDTIQITSGVFAMDNTASFSHTFGSMLVNGGAIVDLGRSTKAAATISISGNLIQSGVSTGYIWTSGNIQNGKINFNGSGAIQNLACATTAYIDFIVNSPSRVQLTGDVALFGALISGTTYTTTFTVGSSAILDCKTFAIKSFSGTIGSQTYAAGSPYTYFLLNAGGTLASGNANGLVCATSSATLQTVGSGATGSIQTAYRSFASASTYVYNGTIAQVTGSFITASSNTSISKLYIDNSAGVTLSQATTLTTSLTIGDTTDNSIFYDNGYQITSVGTINLGDIPYDNTVYNNASKFILGATGRATTFPTFGTIIIGSGTTVQYNSSLNQTVSGTPKYYNLLISGGATKTLGAATTIYGKLNISSGTILVVSGTNYGITLGGNWTNAGTFTARNGTVTLNGGATSTQLESSTQTITSNGNSFYNLTHSGSYTAQLIINPLATTASFLNSAGTFDANALSHTVTGTATISGGTYNASTSTQTFNGGLIVSGGTFTGSTGNVSATGVTLSSGTLTAPSGTFSVSGNWLQSGGTFAPGSNTVTFTLGSGTQTINSGGVSNSAFNNILHSGAGVLQILSNALVTGGTFTNASGAGNFDANSQAHTVTGLATLSAANYLASSGTQTFNGGITINTGASLTAGTGTITQGGSGNFFLVNGGTFTGSTGTVNATNVTISSGTLLAPSAALNVSGNWLYNGGTFSHNSGLVNFSGTALQTLGGTLSSNFYDLENSNSVGTSIITSAGTYVNHTLNLAAGVINTSNTFLLTMNAGSSATVANSVSGVPQANSPYVNGPLQKVGNTDFIFPVGVNAASTGAVPIGISASTGSATDVFRAEYRHESAGLLNTYNNNLPNATLLLDHVSRCDYWTLKLVSGTPTVSVTGYWNDNNLCLGQTLPNTPSHYVNNLPDIGLAHYDSTTLYAWDKFGGYNGYLGGLSTATGNQQLGSVTLVNVSNFSPFALGSSTVDNPLPVVLVNFEAVLNPNKTAGLSWTTQQELGMSHFEVERSADGLHWTAIGRVTARGNSPVPTDYVYTDESPLTGANYYRIRMVNVDDISGLTKIKVVRLLQVKGISVFPVPARDFVNVTISGATVDLNIKLINQLGQVMQVSQVKAGANTTLTLDVHNYAQGSYLLQVMGADGTQQTSKVVIMR